MDKFNEELKNATNPSITAETSTKTFARPHGIRVFRTFRLL